jgi:phosphatidylglycerol:prolipoprotein diacylglycerol transferase
MKYPEWLSPFIISPDIPLRWYGTMYVFGFLTAFLMMRHYIKKKEFKIPLEEEGGLYDLMMYLILGLMIGARVGNYILYSPEVFVSRPWEVIGLHYRLDGKFSHFALSGMSFHGGLFGVFVAILIFLRRYNYKLSHIGDWAVLAATPGLFFGRMGNFLNAELYGTKTTSIWGIKFPLYDKVGGYEKWVKLPPALRPYTEPRHASQLYEALLEGLVLMLILLFIKSRKPARGVMAWAFIAFYGLFRTMVEFVRDPSIAWSLGWFTSGMFYSVPMCLVGVAMMIHLQQTRTSTIGDDSSPYRNAQPPKISASSSKSGAPAKERPRPSSSKTASSPKESSPSKTSNASAEIEAPPKATTPSSGKKEAAPKPAQPSASTPPQQKKNAPKNPPAHQAKPNKNNKKKKK